MKQLSQLWGNELNKSTVLLVLLLILGVKRLITQLSAQGHRAYHYVLSTLHEAPLEPHLATKLQRITAFCERHSASMRCPAISLTRTVSTRLISRGQLCIEGCVCVGASVINHAVTYCLHTHPARMSSKFHWALEGLDESRFQAFISLLRLRNGGQLSEPCDGYDYSDDELGPTTSGPGTDYREADSTSPQQFTNFDERELRQRFLDRTAELVSGVHGGSHVTSTLLAEWPGKAQVLVAKNNLPSEGDLEIIQELQHFIEVIAKSDGKQIPHSWCHLCITKPRCCDHT